MIKRKGQVAIEFLTTYGWALLVITAVIGAFVYIQTSPKDYIKSDCAFNENLECISHRVTEDELEMEVKNVAGEPITINRIICTLNTDEYENADSYDLNAGDDSIISCDISDVIDEELVKINVVVYYTVDGFDFPRTAEGNVVGYVSS